MGKSIVLQTRVDATTAARVRLEAERTGMAMSEWIAEELRRAVVQAGAADALALKGYELALTVGYMLRALMVEAMGAEGAEKAVEEAAETAGAEAAAELAAARGEAG
jgi:hypothetical protein